MEQEKVGNNPTIKIHYLGTTQIAFAAYIERITMEQRMNNPAFKQYGDRAPNIGDFFNSVGRRGYPQGQAQEFPSELVLNLTIPPVRVGETAFIEMPLSSLLSQLAQQTEVYRQKHYADESLMLIAEVNALQFLAELPEMSSRRVRIDFIKNEDGRYRITDQFYEISEI